MTPAKAKSMLAVAEKALAKSQAKAQAAQAKADAEIALRDEDAALVETLRRMAGAVSTPPEPAVPAPQPQNVAAPAKPNGGRGTVEEQVAAGRQIVFEDASES